MKGVMVMKATIVFVYNADSGLFNTLTDIAHKAFAPETYSCNLCAITFGLFGMREEWKGFLETLDNGMEFLHRDELGERYGITGIELPAIFIKHADTLKLWISATEINACSNIDELKQLINSNLGERSDI